MPIDRNVGIPISRQAFRARAEQFLQRMTRGESFRPEEHLELVRIWNTAQSLGLATSDALLRDYARLYMTGYLQASVAALEATLTKGMCYYSKEHDVFIGGKPHANSQYRLEP